MGKKKIYKIPRPIISKKEEYALTRINDRYIKMTTPGMIGKVGGKVKKAVPKSIKKIASSTKNSISENTLFLQCMDVLAKGFGLIEKQAAKASISERAILKKINNSTKQNDITSIDEICLVRSYEISKLVNSYRSKDNMIALIEGAITGAFGFSGLFFNLVLSTFIFYRAVQSVAMFYGYDVKNEPSELVIATDVFMNALSPKSSGGDELSSVITKIMVMSETTAIKQTVKKSWTEMASRGGASLLITQMRALANKSAEKALEKVGQKGLEESLFKEVFEQIGKKLTKETVGKSMPVIGAFVGGLFDIVQMNTILEYADVFYHKRFLLEKEERINLLIGEEDEIVVEVDPGNISVVD